MVHILWATLAHAFDGVAVWALFVGSRGLARRWRPIGHIPKFRGVFLPAVDDPRWTENGSNHIVLKTSENWLGIVGKFRVGALSQWNDIEISPYVDGRYDKIGTWSKYARAVRASVAARKHTALVEKSIKFLEETP